MTRERVNYATFVSYHLTQLASGVLSIVMIHHILNRAFIAVPTPKPNRSRKIIDGIEAIGKSSSDRLAGNGQQPGKVSIVAWVTRSLFQKLQQAVTQVFRSEPVAYRHRRSLSSQRRLLSMESLETRRVFTGQPWSASLSGGTLSISLFSSDLSAYLSNDGASLRVGANTGGSEVKFDTSAVTSISVTDTFSGGATNQTFSLANGLPLSLSGAFSVSNIETVVLSGELTVSGTAGVSITGSTSIQVAAPLTTAGKPLTLTASSGITITQPVITNGGNQSLSADSDANGSGALTLDFPFTEFTDPNPSPGNQFGSVTQVLTSGNVVITSPYDDAGGTDAGAVYLFNAMTGSLVSSLRGSTPQDNVGLSGITTLTNGNYVVSSTSWNSGSLTAVGAVTWGNSVTGSPGGVVSSSNSLVGSTADDRVGSYYVVALTNGNYVVASFAWDSGTLLDVGAVTWGNGSTGITGVVSSTNSLVGSTTYDNVGSSYVVALTNGNYVVASPSWNFGALQDVGAVTWGNGSTGITGVVSSTNSLVGSRWNDLVGRTGLTALTNGNYVVRSSNWGSGTVSNVGAVTWGNGSTGITGVVSSTNSLVGSGADDNVGRDITVLTNGNYVVRCSSWDSGTVSDVGAVTWGNGSTGITGVVSSTNSLVGSTAFDMVGRTGLTALTNGNYVVRSSNWDSGTVSNVGAATWGNGSTGITGVVSSTNSLVGSGADDNVGSTGLTALTNGNYVVRSSNWDSGTVSNVGAATWGNGSTGITGVVSSTNSLVGSSIGDGVSGSRATALTNGNYVVVTTRWDFGTVPDVGAVTWGNGSTGITGVVSSTNSLVGSTNSDLIGSTGFTELTNGNYVVASSNWDSGTVSNVGAVTWGDGSTAITGLVSSTNSLVGSTASDSIGNGRIRALTNGNYVVASFDWDFGTATNAGAVTWGNGTQGITGVVSSSNSLVGSTMSDNVGDRGDGTSLGVIALANGAYAVLSGKWDSGTLTNVGAVTWGGGTTGISGVVSSSNSIVGKTADKGSTWRLGGTTGIDAFVAQNPQDGSGRVVLGSAARGFGLPTSPKGNLQAAGGTIDLSTGADLTTGGLRPKSSGVDAQASITKLKSGGTLRIDINGSTVDTQYNQLSVGGPLTIETSGTGVALRLSVGAGSIAGTETFTIVSTTGVITGAFAGLAQGASVTVGTFPYKISYGTNSIQLVPNLNVPPSITTQPSDQAVTAGNTATYSAAASGTPTPMVQWQISTNGGLSWSNIAGATSSTYTTPPLTAGNDGNVYRAVYTNIAGSAATAAAVLRVNQAPAVTLQPLDVATTSGATATFTANASGWTAPTVQWQINSGDGWSDITGATGNSYTTPSLAGGDSGNQYRAVFSNSLGSATTNTATLTIASLATITNVAVGWGTQTANLVDVGSGRLLPTGRTNTIAWLGITQITLTLDQSIASLTTADITLSGNSGFSYGVASVSGSGTAWTITLSGSGLVNADRVTVNIGGGSIVTYSRRLDVLPGDVNDDGVVTVLDQMTVSRQIALAYNSLYDIDGSGSVSSTDVSLVKSRLGRRLR
jgi:hypothetical protein